MKILPMLAHLLVGSVLLSATPVFAENYTTVIGNCSITKIGDNQWQAKFTNNVEYCSEDKCIEYHNNTFEAYLMQVNARGKPYATPGRETVASAGWNGLTLSNSSAMKASQTDLKISFSAVSSPTNIIKISSSVSVNFSTAGNNAYPALLLIVQRRFGPTSDGGNESDWWVTTNGCQRSINNLPHVDEVNPPEPAFTMKSAAWELNTVDIGDLPDVMAGGKGYPATIKNITNNNLCFSYVTAGVKKNSYALSVTNSAVTQGGKQVFMMRSGDSQLPYSLQLSSNKGGTADDFTFPAAEAKFITLSQAASNVSKRSEMCWTPQIQLFKNGSTAAGMHMDTLNFIIIPKA